MNVNGAVLAECSAIPLVICGWCQVVTRRGTEEEWRAQGYGVSHGICLDCATGLLRKAGLKLVRDGDGIATLERVKQSKEVL